MVVHLLSLIWICAITSLYVRLLQYSISFNAPLSTIYIIILNIILIIIIIIIQLLRLSSSSIIIGITIKEGPF